MTFGSVGRENIFIIILNQAQGSVTSMPQRFTQNDLFFDAITDSDSCLLNAFLILKDALQRWSHNYINSVLLFDTSHATSKYGFKQLLTVINN